MSMKKIVIVLIAMVATLNLYSQEVTTYDEFINVIKENNPSLKALELTLDAKKESNRIGNTPSDPLIAYAPYSNGATSYMVSVSFLFPTMYYQVKKKAKMATQKNEFEYYVALFQEMQNIDNTYVTVVYINKKVELLREAYKGNESIKKLFLAKVKEGKSSVLELNTAKGELLRSFSAVAEAKLEYRNIHSKLLAINGGIDIEVKMVNYPNFNIGSLESFVERAMDRSYAIKVAEADSLLVSQNVRIAKHSWAPTIALSYNYNTIKNASNTNYSGAEIDISVPLWQNSHKIRAARLEYSAMMQNNRKVQLEVVSKLEQLKNNYLMALENNILHEEFTSTSSNIKLLRKSLSQGKLSAIDYYVEVNRIIEIELQKLEYEYRVVAAIAEMQSLLY